MINSFSFVCVMPEEAGVVVEEGGGASLKVRQCVAQACHKLVSQLSDQSRRSRIQSPFLPLPPVCLLLLLLLLLGGNQQLQPHRICPPSAPTPSSAPTPATAYNFIVMN